MTRISIKINGINITKEHLNSQYGFFVPSLESHMTQVSTNKWHMPFISGTHSSEEALNWCNAQDCWFHIFFDTIEEARQLLTDPIWSKARLDHDKSFNTYGIHCKGLYKQGVMKCDCCNNLIGYFYHDTYVVDQFLCVNCIKECIEE